MTNTIADIQNGNDKERSPLSRVVRRLFLADFFQITLTSTEAELANDAVDNKYTVAIAQAFVYGLLLVPALFLLNTEIVVSVLIPTTMVAGTAWFSVSLASIKAKFENFGMELTTDLFVAFTLSLLMLFLATATSLTKEFWEAAVLPFSESTWISGIAALLAICVVGKLVFSIFSGSLKYDINDAMLTGQNEAAERFFKKSLSVLHNTSEVLKNGRSLHVANYSIGVAFYEVFSSIRESSPTSDANKIRNLIEEANRLVEEPSMAEDKANDITISLTNSFLESCRKSVPDSVKDKSFAAIEDEIECLFRTQELTPKKTEMLEQRLQEELKAQSNEELSPLGISRVRKELSVLVMNELDGAEDQEMTDLRISVILTEISNLIEEYGYRIRID